MCRVDCISVLTLNCTCLLVGMKEYRSLFCKALLLWVLFLDYVPLHSCTICFPCCLADFQWAQWWLWAQRLSVSCCLGTTKSGEIAVFLLAKWSGGGWGVDSQVVSMPEVFASMVSMILEFSYLIARLNSINYLTCSQKVQILLKKESFWNIVSNLPTDMDEEDE